MLQNENCSTTEQRLAKLRQRLAPLAVTVDEATNVVPFGRMTIYNAINAGHLPRAQTWQAHADPRHRS